MRIDLDPAVLDDLVDGHRFYERQSPGLGEYFLDSLFSDLDSLQLFAGIHEKHFGYHRMLAKRFPFAVYYRMRDENVLVYAILDCRRNPAWTRERLS